MPEPEPQTKTKPARDPQALTSEYHKARKQLLLWAGILLIWALVGVDLSKAEAAGGSVGAIITAIKSPQAVPWVLVILVAYFLFKTTIEWYQCNLNRRKLWVSRIDFSSAWFVSLGAFSLYFGQKIANVRLADVFTYSTMVSLLVGGLIGFWLFSCLGRFRRLRNERRLTMGYFVVILSLALLVPAICLTVSSLLMGFFGSRLHWGFILSGCLLFLIPLGGASLFLPNVDWSLPPEPKTAKEL